MYMVGSNGMKKQGEYTRDTYPARLKVPPFAKIHQSWVSHCVAGDPAPEGTAEGAGETGGYSSDGVP